MGTIAQHDPSVNSMPAIDADRLRRDLGIHRAAQLLADASRIRQGLPARPLNRLDPDDREWFKQTARHQIEVFELVTQPDRETDAIVAQRQAVDRRVAQALESRLSQERSRARFIASERGHDLTSWGPEGAIEGDERATCRRCVRSAHISLGTDPAISGSALTEGCIVAADESADLRRV